MYTYVEHYKKELYFNRNKPVMIYCVPRINTSVSKMNSYFTNILFAKTTKNLHITFSFSPNSFIAIKVGITRLFLG